MTEEQRARKREQGRAYYAANREKLIATTRAWYAADPERARAAGRAYYAANREKCRDAKRKQLYGSAAENITGMLAEQNACCAICQTSFSNTPQVDHDHKTGKVRGLLCSACNRLLAACRDSEATLLRAVDYLRSTSQ